VDFPFCPLIRILFGNTQMRENVMMPGPEIFMLLSTELASNGRSARNNHWLPVREGALIEFSSSSWSSQVSKVSAQNV
jgi:hypothetical protein